MNWQRIAVALFGVALVGLAYRAYGLPGVAMAVGGIVMWMLLSFTRATTVLQRAAKHPVGWVASAVMLNAKLKTGVTLLHVLALTRALGELRSPKDEQPEIYRWTDNGGSHVTCEFAGGKLVRWELLRPVEPEGQAPGALPHPARVAAENAGNGP